MRTLHRTMKPVIHFSMRRPLFFKVIVQTQTHVLTFWKKSVISFSTANLQQENRSVVTSPEALSDLSPLKQFKQAPDSDPQGALPYSDVYFTVLQECIRAKDLAGGRVVHAHIIKTGFHTDLLLGSKLVIMYVKCRSLEDAGQVFEKLPEQTLVSWNAILAGYAQNGRLQDARQVFDKMPERNVVSWTAMIAGFVQEARLEEARQLFDIMPERNVVSWTAMIVGYSQSGYCEESLKLFYQMQNSGTKPNPFTFNIVLSTCANLGNLEQSNHIY